MTYLVRESFQVVIRRDDSSLGYTIMPGSTVTILGDAEQSGTVRISYTDRIATAPCGIRGATTEWYNPQLLTDALGRSASSLWNGNRVSATRTFQQQGKPK
jgi:hypothetical protein